VSWQHYPFNQLPFFRVFREIFGIFQVNPCRRKQFLY
ncbi:transposase, partial [Shigella flexneri]